MKMYKGTSYHKRLLWRARCGTGKYIGTHFPLEVEAALVYDSYVDQHLPHLSRNFGEIFQVTRAGFLETLLHHTVQINDVLVYQGRIAVIREDRNIYHVVDRASHKDVVLGIGSKYKDHRRIVDEVLPYLHSGVCEASDEYRPVFIQLRQSKYQTTRKPPRAQRKRVEKYIYQRPYPVDEPSFEVYAPVNGKRTYVGIFFSLEDARKALKGIICSTDTKSSKESQT